MKNQFAGRHLDFIALHTSLLCDVHFAGRHFLLKAGRIEDITLADQPKVGKTASHPISKLFT